MKKLLSYFTPAEWVLWGTSTFAIVLSYLLFRGSDPVSFAASLLGVTSLVLIAKGNPYSQILMLIFCIMYAIVSWSFSYYGEMLTYLAMTAPMSVFAFFSWLMHPYKGSRCEVAVGKMDAKKWWILSMLAVVVTVIFYFVLAYFDTANLIPSTISVTTSFFAAGLMFLRAPYYALAYALNDVVLIVLWVLASLEDISYVSVVVCFCAFLANDIYCYYSWKRMSHRQNA